MMPQNWFPTTRVLKLQSSLIRYCEKYIVYIPCNIYYNPNLLTYCTIPFLCQSKFYGGTYSFLSFTLLCCFFPGFQWSIFERPTEASLFHFGRIQNGLSSGLPNATTIWPFLLFYFFIHEGSYWSSCQSPWMSTQALKINLAWDDVQQKRERAYNI